MTLDEQRARVDAGEIDTVLLALCDMQGRLQGKRLTARHFVVLHDPAVAARGWPGLRRRQRGLDA